MRHCATLRHHDEKSGGAPRMRHCATCATTFIGGRSGGDANPLLMLAEKVRHLSPSHRDPERFHMDKSEIERDLRRLGDAYEVREGGGGQIKTAWAGMLKRAGITDFSPHDCRHTWATWHYRANRDLTALMELGGWKSAAMVMRYAHVNTSHLAGSISQIWGKSGDSPSPSQRKPKQGAA